MQDQVDELQARIAEMQESGHQRSGAAAAVAPPPPPTTPAGGVASLAHENEALRAQAAQQAQRIAQIEVRSIACLLSSRVPWLTTGARSRVLHLEFALEQVKSELL
jgi:cell division septum initiation protein DivIVA